MDYSHVLKVTDVSILISIVYLFLFPLTVDDSKTRRYSQKVTQNKKKQQKLTKEALDAQRTLHNIQFNTTFKIASKNDTMRFSGINQYYNNDILVVSGTWMCCVVCDFGCVVL